MDRTAYKREIRRVREEGIAFDREEYIEGMVALSVPIRTHRTDLQTAVWAVGLKRQAPEAALPGLSTFLKNTADEINRRFDMEPGAFSGP